ncbi:MAG: hypothetical protein ACLR23_00350 [Clostridia bacterium]
MCSSFYLMALAAMEAMAAALGRERGAPYCAGREKEGRKCNRSL